MTKAMEKNFAFAIKHGDYNVHAKAQCICALTSKKVVEQMLERGLIRPITFNDPRAKFLSYFKGKTVTVYAIN